MTGGAGYIGSHLAARLLEQGHRVVVLDDLSRGTEDAMVRAERLGAGWLEREIGDVCDRAFVQGVFDRWKIHAVAHLAAWKSVAGSVADPAGTRRANVGGTTALAEAMTEAGVGRVVHASTAAVYGEREAEPLGEDDPQAPISPYAQTKQEAEGVLDAGAEALGWGVVHLRFFNVCGAHPSGQLGERTDHATNLMPVAVAAAMHGRPVEIFGTDYPTRDGTCVRDYIHVEDIVEGLLLALRHTARVPGTAALNLGTGRGRTVLEVLDAVERASGQPIARVSAPRRVGDPIHSVADPSGAARVLGWRSTWELDAMAAHAWAWVNR